MKKILILLLVLLLSICGAFAHKNKRYLVRNYEYYYDLNTFNYDFNKKTTSIDVIYNIDPSLSEKRIKSAADGNFIQYLIFNTKLDNTRLDVEYKGFVTGVWIAKKDSILFKNAKIYYDKNENLIPNIKGYIADFKNCAELTNYKNDISEILEAQNKNSLYKMQGLYSTLNRYNDI